VVEAMLKATDESLSGQTYNIGSEDSIELGSLARLLCELEGGSSAVELVPFPPERKLIDIGDYVGDYSAFRAATGWCAETGLQQGLMDTLAYYRAAMQFYLE
jgi:nucleoside-diphosphate-sugar epimerase